MNGKQGRRVLVITTAFCCACTSQCPREAPRPEAPPPAAVPPAEQPTAVVTVEPFGKIVPMSPWIGGGSPGTITPRPDGGGLTQESSEDFGYQHGLAFVDEARKGLLLEQWFLASQDRATKKHNLKMFPARLPLAESKASAMDVLLKVGLLGNAPVPAPVSPWDFYKAVREDILREDMTGVRYAFGGARYVSGMPPEPSAGGIPTTTKGVAEAYRLQGNKVCHWFVFALRPVEPAEDLKERGFEKQRRLIQAFGGDQCSANVGALSKGTVVESDSPGPDEPSYGKWRNSLEAWCGKKCVTTDGWLAIDSDGSHTAWVNDEEIWDNAPKPK